MGTANGFVSVSVCDAAVSVASDAARLAGIAAQSLTLTLTRTLTAVSRRRGP